MSRFVRSHLSWGAAVLVGALFLLTSCGASDEVQSPDGGHAGEEGEPTAGGTLMIGGLRSKAYDPGVPTYSSQARPQAFAVYSSLFQLTETGEVGPELASGYEYSDDDLQLTITLRDDLVFADGTPLDAEAVIWNFQRYIDNETREAQFFQFVTDIDATDDATVVVTFSQPQGVLLDALATSSSGFMISQAALAQMGADAFSAAPVGAGPFKIESVDPGQEIHYVKNDLYWDAEHVYLDGIDWLDTGNDAQGWLTNLQSGAIQSVAMDGNFTAASVLTAIDGDSTLQLQSGIGTYVAVLPVNTFHAPFDDIRARQAVNYCMDREAIADSVMRDWASPAFVLGGDTWALDDWEEGKALNPIHPDVEKGTALVEELGGLRFTVTATSLVTTLLTALQQQWAECGIDAQLQFTDDYLTMVQNGNYEATMIINSNAALNPASFTGLLDPNEANNKFGWRDETIWSMVQEAKGTVDETKATELWHKIWAALDENGFVNPILSAPTYTASTTKLHGVVQYSVLPDYTNSWLEQ